MRILFYINTLEKGGAERVITNLADNFAENGHSVFLVTTYKRKEEYKTNSHVIKICIEEYTKFSSNKLIKNIDIINTLKNIIKDVNPDICVSFMREPNVRLILATTNLKIKTVISVRNDPLKEYPGIIGSIISKYILPKADGCVFQTKDAMSYFPKSLQNKSEIIFNQVSDTFFSVKRKNPKYIVSIGRLEPQKNHLLLINAFETISKKYPNEKLLIYGEGSLRKKLLEEIRSRNLDNKIFLKGTTEDVAKILSVAKIFVLSSNYEGMPNALLEALAVGVPCISTDCPCGGPKEVINSSENGLLFPVNDKEELVRNMKILLDDTDLSYRIGQKAKEKSNRFKPENVFLEWSNYLDTIVNRNNN